MFLQLEGWGINLLKWKEYSLRRQILLVFILLQLFLLVFLLLYFNNSQRQSYLKQLEESLYSQAILLREQLGSDISNFSPDTLDSRAKEIGGKIDKRITIVARDGLVIADSQHNPEVMDNHRNRPEIDTVIQGKEKGLSIRWSDTINIEMFYLAIPVYNQGNVSYVIRISESLQEINNTISRTIRANLIFFFFIILVSVFLLWKLSKGIIKPLNNISTMAENLAKGDFQQRINIKNYNYEISTLAGIFNKMAEELDSNIKQISAEKNRAEAILESMVEGLIATDKYLNVKIINPSAKNIFALNKENVSGNGIMEVFRHHEIEETLKKALEKSEIISREIIINREDEITLRCNFAPINNEMGEVIGGIVVFSDISELRRLEQLRKDFVSNVSHELRTPLTSIIGYVDTIIENEIKEKSTLEQFLKVIKVEADRLAILIKDLLDLSKLENKQNYILRPANLNNVINKVLTLLQDKAEKKNISLKVKIAKDFMVLMIPDQIEQVLINLLDNAIKYTPADGEVYLKAYEKEDMVFIEVIDNGIGIPLEEQDRIFERFYRIDRARSSSGGGTGIGLSIVKHALKNHNSNIELESLPGKGSVFRFYLEKAK
ncbi:MAG: ATP-binding protein [bacterium]